MADFNVIERINGIEHKTYEANIGEINNFDVDSSSFVNLPDGNNTISIIATNLSTGYSNTKLITFKKITVDYGKAPRAIKVSETRIYDDPQDPENSQYTVVLPITVADAVYMPNGLNLSDYLFQLLTGDSDINIDEIIRRIQNDFKSKFLNLGGWAQFVRNGIDLDILGSIGLR